MNKEAMMRRFLYWLQRTRSDRELAEELESHRLMRQVELQRAGMDEAEAVAASRRALGNTTLALEDAREIWGWPPLEGLWQDVRYGVRSMRRLPTFSLTAILILALGIGVTTTAFSFAHAEVWKPLPFADADRLVAVFSTLQDAPARYDRASGPELLDWRAQNHAFEQLAAYRSSARQIVKGRKASESMIVLPVTSNFFATLRRDPVLGRMFGPADEEKELNAILSHAAWHRYFGGDPAVIGSPVVLADRPYTIVGVASDEPLEFLQTPDVFVVMSLRSPDIGDRNRRDVQVFGRLKAGVDAAAAEADLRIVSQRLQTEYPDEHAGRDVRVEDLRESYTGSYWRHLLFFLGASAFVLLLTCANVANLLLARALTRQREFAIRRALGGGWSALSRQLIVEGWLLALPGAAVGLLFARWAIDVLPAWIPSEYLGRGAEIELDLRVFLFTLSITALTAMAFGLAPLVFAAGRRLNPTLTLGGRSSTSTPTQRRGRQALVVMEVALALVLLAGAGLFLNSFIRLTRVPLGFEPAGRLTMRIPLGGARYADQGALTGFAERLVGHARAVPGIADAAVGTSVPLGSGPPARFAAADRPRPDAGHEPRAIMRAVTPGYFGVLGVGLLAGRDFDAEDAPGTRRVAIVNETLARRIFPDEDPIGKALTILPGAGLSWINTGTIEIVGVVGNVKEVMINEVAFNDIYLPLAQTPVSSLMLIVNASVPPESVVEPLRAVVAALDSDLPVYAIATMGTLVDGALGEDRFNLLLIGAFALLALVMAGMGIYGAMAYSVEQRTAEFGVRLALGARPIGILSLALQESARLAIVGTTLGLAIALVLARILGDALFLVPGQHMGLLYDVALTDPPTLAVACAALLTVATLSGLVPATRATRVDPVVALRNG